VSDYICNNVKTNYHQYKIVLARMAFKVSKSFHCCGFVTKLKEM